VTRSAMMTPAGRRLAVRWLPAVVVAAALTTTACSAHEPDGAPRMTTENQLAELRARPTLERAAETQDVMLAELRAGIDAVVGAGAWLQRDDTAGGSGCRDFDPDLGGEERGSSSWVLQGGVPDAAWPAVQAVVTEVAARYGLDRVDVVKDEPGQHVVMVLGADGASLDARTGPHFVMGARTGCHLPEGV
jgi:hypothetical protein